MAFSDTDKYKCKVFLGEGLQRIDGVVNACLISRKMPRLIGPFLCRGIYRDNEVIANPLTSISLLTS